MLSYSGPITISYPIFLYFGFILVGDCYIRIALINRLHIYSLSYIRMNQKQLIKKFKAMIEQVKDSGSRALLWNLKQMILNESRLNSSSKKELCDYINLFI